MTLHTLHFLLVAKIFPATPKKEKVIYGRKTNTNWQPLKRNRISGNSKILFVIFLLNSLFESVWSFNIFYSDYLFWFNGHFNIFPFKIQIIAHGYAVCGIAARSIGSDSSAEQIFVRCTSDIEWSAGGVRRLFGCEPRWDVTTWWRLSTASGLKYNADKPIRWVLNPVLIRLKHDRNQKKQHLSVLQTARKTTRKT